MKQLSSILLAFLILATAGSAGAGHYFIKDVKEIRKYAQRLARMKIGTTKDLLLRAATRRARWRLSRKTGISMKKLKNWFRMAEFLQISGVGPKMVRLIRDAGVKTLAAFKRAEAKKLARRIAKGPKRGLLPGAPLPMAGQISYWQELARKSAVQFKGGRNKYRRSGKKGRPARR